MTTSNEQIRAQARNTLGKNLFKSTWILTAILLALHSLLLSFIGKIGTAIATLIFTGPLTFGLHKELVSIARGKGDVDLLTLGDGFHGFLSNMLLAIMQTIFVTLWSILFIVPGIIKSYAYSMTYFIKVDHPEYGWRECLKESERIMKGNKLKLFLLKLSFIGWDFVGILTLGIGYIWIAPYKQVAIAAFYDQLTSNNEDVKDTVNS